MSHALVARRFDLRRHIRHHVLDGLETRNGLSELNARFRKLKGFIESALRNSDGLGADSRTRLIERFHCDSKRASFFR